MSGVKGRSGRKPLAVELQKHAVIIKAWRKLDKALDDDNHKIEYKDQVYVAAGVVKADMAKAIIIDQSEHHTHLTRIEINSLEDSQIVETLTGRINGNNALPSKSA